MKFPVQTIVVPTDFSDLSLQALQTALGLAGGHAERLHIVTVLLPIVPPSPGIVWGNIDDTDRIARVREALDELLAEKGFGESQCHVTIGQPANTIADLAKQVGADVVVVTSHGRTGLVRAALGSVAERVVRLAPCPVLVLKSKD